MEVVFEELTGQTQNKNKETEEVQNDRQLIQKEIIFENDKEMLPLSQQPQNNREFMQKEVTFENDKQILPRFQQKLQERQVILEQKTQILNQLQCDVEQEKQLNLYENLTRTKLEKSFKESESYISKFIEYYNQLKAIIKLCINDQKQFSLLNQDLERKFNQFKTEKENETIQYKRELENYSNRREILNTDYLNELVELEKAINNNDADINMAESKMNHFELKIDEYEHKNRELVREINEIFTQHTELDTQHSELQETIEKFRENHKEENQSFDDQIVDLKKNLRANNSRIQTVLDEKNTLEIAYNNQEEFLYDFKRKNQDFETITIPKCEQEIFDVGTKLDDLHKMEAVLDEKQNESEIKNGGVVNDLEKMIVQIGDEIKNLELNITQSELKRKNLTQNFETTKTELKTKENHLNQISSVIEENKSNYVSSLMETERKLIEKQTEHKKLTDEQDLLNNRITSTTILLEAEMQECENVEKQAKDKEVEFNLNYDHLTSEKHELEKTLEDKQFDLDNMKIAIEDNAKLDEDLDLELNYILEENKKRQHEIETNFLEEQKLGNDEIVKLNELFINLDLKSLQLTTSISNLENEIEIRIRENAKLDHRNAPKFNPVEKTKKKELDELFSATLSPPVQVEKEARANLQSEAEKIVQDEQKLERQLYQRLLEMFQNMDKEKSNDNTAKTTSQLETEKNEQEKNMERKSYHQKLLNKFKTMDAYILEEQKLKDLERSEKIQEYKRKLLQELDIDETEHNLKMKELDSSQRMDEENNEPLEVLKTKIQAEIDKDFELEQRKTKFKMTEPTEHDNIYKKMMQDVIDKQLPVKEKPKPDEERPGTSTTMDEPFKSIESTDRNKPSQINKQAENSKKRVKNFKYADTPPKKREKSVFKKPMPRYTSSTSELSDSSLDDCFTFSRSRAPANQFLIKKKSKKNICIDSSPENLDDIFNALKSNIEKKMGTKKNKPIL